MKRARFWYDLIRQSRHRYFYLMEETDDIAAQLRVPKGLVEESVGMSPDHASFAEAWYKSLWQMEQNIGAHFLTRMNIYAKPST